VPNDHTYYLPVSGADLRFLQGLLQDAAEVRQPNDMELARVLLRVESLAPESECEKIVGHLKAGFEASKIEAAAYRNRAIALNTLVNEAKRNPSEFSIL
jgi:hypothetical protein